MKVFLVVQKDWDTEGYMDMSVAGVFSSMEKIPERYKDPRKHSYSDAEIKELTLDEVGVW